MQANGGAVRGAPSPVPRAAAALPPAAVEDAAAQAYPALAGEFREWCIAQVWALLLVMCINNPTTQTRKLLGTDDLTFIEMLMGVPANGEVAEIIAANFDNSPDSAGFAAEFIRRKTEYIARGGAEGKKKKRRG